MAHATPSTHTRHAAHLSTYWVSVYRLWHEERLGCRSCWMVVEVHHDGSYDAIPAHAGERCVVSRVWCSTAQMRLGCVVGGHHRAVDVRGMRWVVCCVLPLFKSPPCFVRFADFGRTCTKSCARTSAFRRCHQQRTILVPSHSFRRNYALLIFRFRKRNYGLPTLSEYRVRYTV